ncbi:uncharacterized protein C8A04DRAFT_24148 [Dichotomopilus funicola]|uniref:dihydroneopterin aldolase n=1 Tax=Dichotomopilus funicola TaxID=1934379 RepID=A0AAN6VA13_9PEZI|nr:hypothetical protein C8A04DRAFT_24148 [Dichotomopilus funicola]
MPQSTTHPRLRAQVPHPPAVVHIRNLSTILTRAGHDAWGRAGKSQPCLVSAEVAFRDPFGRVSESDSLGEETVHYGTLSKRVLGLLEGYEKEAEVEKGEEKQERGVREVLERVWVDFLGLGLDGLKVVGSDGKGESTSTFLNPKRLSLLSLAVDLPKASLLGDGVKLTTSAVFDEGGSVIETASALEVTKLKVPTLIGVNANERLAKQFVIATVTVEGYTRKEDIYVEIERAVVKAMEESSFETLEALGALLAQTVLAFSFPQEGWWVRVRMEKPTAVPMAECPIVEVQDRLH